MLAVEHLHASLEPDVRSLLPGGREDAESSFRQCTIDCFGERCQINWHIGIILCSRLASCRRFDNRRSRSLLPDDRRDPGSKELDGTHYMVVRHRSDAEVQQEAVVLE